MTCLKKATCVYLRTTKRDVCLSVQHKSNTSQFKRSIIDVNWTPPLNTEPSLTRGGVGANPLEITICHGLQDPFSYPVNIMAPIFPNLSQSMPRLTSIHS